MTGRVSTGEEGGPPTSKTDHARSLVERSVEELARQLEAGNSTQLDAFLRTMGRFHRYSFSNILLIMMQKPEATRVAGFHTWRSLGRAVRRGEKGIAIFAPMMLKPKALKDGESSADDEPEAAPRLRFRVVHVFDVSQTDGEPLAEMPRVGGNPGEALSRLEAAVTASGIELETVTSLGGAEGVSSGGRIRLRDGLLPAERFAVLVHEWAHERLHQVDRSNRPEKVVRETEAEAVAFVVCQAVGLETGTVSADYIRLYRGDKDTLTASLDKVQKTAAAIIEAVLGDKQPDQRRSPPPITHPLPMQRQR